jgi:hypothetical protein
MRTDADRAKAREYYWAHVEERRAWKRKHYAEHPEEREIARLSHLRHYPEHRESHKAKGKEWYKTHKEEHSARGRKYYVTNRDLVQARHSEYQRNHPEERRRRQNRHIEKHAYEVLLQNLGRHAKSGGFAPPVLSREKYEELAAVKNCQICGIAENGRKLAFDHDHVTGNVRGRICNSCNLLLGRMTTPEVLRKASDYLERGALP